VKIATALQFTHIRDYVCVGHQDGSVAIFNLRGETVGVYEPPAGLNEPITCIAIKEQKNILAASTTGHVIQWMMSDNPKPPIWM
jgi:hypothetical protein